MRDNLWSYVPGAAFFGAVVTLIEGVLDRSPALIVMGSILSLLCVFATCVAMRGCSR